jgi:hypothetical protein
MSNKDYVYLENRKDVNQYLLRGIAHSPKHEEFLNREGQRSEYKIIRSGCTYKIIWLNQDPELKSLYRLKAKVLQSKIEWKAWWSFTFNDTALKKIEKFSGAIMRTFIKTLKQKISRDKDPDISGKANFEYIWKYEEGKKHNRPHFHMFCSEYIKKSIIDEVWGQGFTYVEKIDNSDPAKLKKYLYKYFSKSSYKPETVKEDVKQAIPVKYQTFKYRLKYWNYGSKRWSSSRGVKFAKSNLKFHTLGYSNEPKVLIAQDMDNRLGKLNLIKFINHQNK